MRLGHNLGFFGRLYIDRGEILTMLDHIHFGGDDAAGAGSGILVIFLSHYDHVFCTLP